MSTLTNFDDNFSEYTPGSTNINGFINNFQGIPQNPTIVNFGTMTGSSSATGFFERSGQGASCNGNVVFQDINNQNDVTATLVTWAGFSNFTNIPVLFIDNVNLATGTSSNPPQFFNLAGLTVNSDYTMSFILPSTNTGGLFSGAAYIETTEQQVVFPYTWQYFQVLFGISSITLSGTIFVKVSCNLGVSGTSVLNGTGVTALPVTNLWTSPAPVVNQWRFAGGGYLGDITSYVANGTSTLPPFGTWPHPATPLQANYTQGVVELGKVSTINTSRMTQGVVEIPSIPSLRYARMTQGVVEIVGILNRPPGGWWVYEA